MNESIRSFFEACQPFGYPLLACSVILLAAILYHGFFSGDNRLLRRLEKLPEKDWEALCRDSRDPLARELLAVLQSPASPTLEKQTEARLRCLIEARRSGLTLISIITNIAPMLGILGTAWGLVSIFGVFGQPDAQDGIALGISKALYTTIFGLAIAVPGIIALSCYERRLGQRAAEVNRFFSILLADKTPH